MKEELTVDPTTGFTWMEVVQRGREVDDSGSGASAWSGCLPKALLRSNK